MGGSLADKVKGKAKEALGTVIGDDALVAEGRLHEAKAEAADDAVELNETAAQKQAEAELTAREKQAAAEVATLAAEADEAAAASAIQADTDRRLASAERAAGTAKAGAETTKRQRIASAEKTEFDAARTYRAEIAEADDIAARARRIRLSARLPRVSPPTTGLAEQVRGLPGRALSSYLAALRLPLTAYERRTGSDASAASIAFEKFDAGVRQLLGSALRDPALLADARRENIEVGRLGEAAELSEAAAAKRARAEQRLAEAKRATESARTSAETAAHEQTAKATERQQSAMGKARSEGASASAAAAEKAADREAAVKTRERAGTAAALRKEQEALAAERAALTRESDVINLDDAVDTSKAARARR